MQLMASDIHLLKGNAIIDPHIITTLFKSEHMTAQCKHCVKSHYIYPCVLTRAPLYNLHADRELSIQLW